MEFVIAQLWWFVLGAFACSFVSMLTLFATTSVAVKLYETNRELLENVEELTKDIVGLKREFAKLQPRRRPGGLMDILTPGSPYEV